MQKLKVAVFGDSIMFGSGNDGYGVGEYIEEKYGFTLLKYCVGGARVGYQEDKSWLVEQVRTAILDKIEPDIIVFDGFTNDCNMTDGVNCDVEFGELCEPQEIFSIKKENADFNLCFISSVAALKKYFKTAEFLFIRPHKMGRREANVQVLYGERAVYLCERYGITVIDIYKESDLNTFLPEHRDRYTNDSYNWGRGDCTHPNDLGYREKYMPLIFAAIDKISERKKI